MSVPLSARIDDAQQLVFEGDGAQAAVGVFRQAAAEVALVGVEDHAASQAYP